MEQTVSKGNKKKFRLRLNTQWKMVLIGLAVVAAFIALIIGYILPSMEKSLMAEKEAKVK